MSGVPRLVLASASPRRRAILERLGIAHEVRPSRAEEVPEPGEGPEAFARRAAGDKAREVMARGELPGGTFVLGADTVVVVDDHILGKPADDAEAADMLRRLSDRWHQVTTAMALGCVGEGLRETVAVTSEVRFRALSDAVVAGYVATGEGRDKAGAYAVQGVGAGLVRELRGSYDNVVGLPATEVIELLERHGAIGAWP